MMIETLFRISPYSGVGSAAASPTAKSHVRDRKCLARPTALHKLIDQIVLAEIPSREIIAIQKKEFEHVWIHLRVVASEESLPYWWRDIHPDHCCTDTYTAIPEAGKLCSYLSLINITIISHVLEFSKIANGSLTRRYGRVGLRQLQLLYKNIETLKTHQHI
jgi:hypothetical protein